MRDTVRMIPGTIRNSQGERLAFSFVSGAPEGRELVVIGHGLTSDKERPWSEAISEGLRGVGIASLRLAFSGNGESEGRFVDSTISKEVEDLGAVIDAFPGWRIAYVGHSMGGAVGLQRALQDERLAALVSLAAVTHCNEFITRMFGELEFGMPMLEKSQCPYGPALLEDMRRLDSLAAGASGVRVPWLILHGSDDDVVPPQHSIDLHRGAPSHATFELLEGVDHSFSGAGIEQMSERVVSWLRGVLS